MKIHDLKIDPQPFADLVSGAKTCEVRNDDRGFEVGDTVRFPGGYTRTISHIQRGYGLPDGLCVLSYAQASAAPEQEAVKGGTFCRICGTKLCVTGVCTIYCPNRNCSVPGVGTKELTDQELARLIAGQPVFEAPSELERLRADLDTMRRKNNEYCDDLMAHRQKLAEAQALLRNIYMTCNLPRMPSEQAISDISNSIKSLLSATAQPAEVKL